MKNTNFEVVEDYINNHVLSNGRIDEYTFSSNQG